MAYPEQPSGTSGGERPPGRDGGDRPPGRHSRGAPEARPEPESAWVRGGTVFAAVLLLLGGVVRILRGVSLIAKDDVYVEVNDYVFRWTASGWGWTLLIIGIVTALAGLGLFRDALWARATGVVVASAGIIADFLWLPYHPVWAVVSIGINAWVIWALTAHRERGAARP